MRRRDQQVTLAALKHCGQRVAGDPHMTHLVDRDDPLPIRLRGACVHPDGDPGVRGEEIDLALAD
jgi:hypothetical protein